MCSRRTAKLIIQPLSLPEMYVVAVILERSDADPDGLSIAREAVACCVQIISVSAVYRILDRLELRGVVIWEHAGKAQKTDARSDRRYRVTSDGQMVFGRSLGFMPIDDRGRIALKVTRFRDDRRLRSRAIDDDDM